MRLPRVAAMIGACAAVVTLNTPVAATAADPSVAGQRAIVGVDLTSAYDAGDSVTTPGSTGGTKPIVASVVAPGGVDTLTICAGNTGPPNGTGIFAQDPGPGYGPGIGLGAAFAAADFTIGTSCVVDSVDIPGIFAYGPGPADSIDVQITGINRARQPGSVMCTATQAGPGPNFNVPFQGCTLWAGTYWLVVQVHQNLDPAGGWYWATTDTRTGYHDLWTNPDDGFGFGCTHWRPLDACPGYPWDYLFMVYARVEG